MANAFLLVLELGRLAIEDVSQDQGAFGGGLHLTPILQRLLVRTEAVPIKSLCRTCKVGRIVRIHVLNVCNESKVECWDGTTSTVVAIDAAYAAANTTFAITIRGSGKQGGFTDWSL
jgi:hypothetical protein